MVRSYYRDIGRSKSRPLPLHKTTATYQKTLLFNAGMKMWHTPAPRNLASDDVIERRRPSRGRALGWSAVGTLRQKAAAFKQYQNIVEYCRYTLLEVVPT